MKNMESSSGSPPSLEGLRDKVWYHLAKIYPYADLNRWTDRVLEIFYPSLEKKGVCHGKIGKPSWPPDTISATPDYGNNEGDFHGKRSWPDAKSATPKHENGEGYFHGKRPWSDAISDTPEYENRICFHGKRSWPDVMPATPKHENGEGYFHGKREKITAHVETLPSNSKWSQEEILLITYGNSITREGEIPLRTLKRFLTSYLKDQIRIVHILPFFPYSSDDGFAVMDYYAVNPGLGTWEDIESISEEFRLMVDLVINHTSSRAGWFENFKSGIDPGRDYYVTVSPDSDLSKVIRPRTSPLLREVETPEGTCHVWCTFSHDQVDLDFKNPEVLLEFLRIIDHYMEKGASIFRLDAVAFLWKELCTTCLHLHQTHEIIKLFRTLLEHRHPHALLITETNVPIHENLSYLGAGDEAHVIYNFPLPPLLLYTLVTGDTSHFNDWLRTSPDPIPGTTYLNFIASHDGIGLRPVEGVLRDEELSALIQCMEAFGGKISTRALNDHRQNPYEINISLWDAFKGTVQTVRESKKNEKSWGKGHDHSQKNSKLEKTVKADAWQFERFICAHAVMLALRGIPAFYIHTLFGTKNDYTRMENTASNRAINRHIWDADLLYRVLNGEGEPSHHKRVFKRLKALIDIRKKEPAFHPDARQIFIESPRGIVSFTRQNDMVIDNTDSANDVQAIHCFYNITDQPVTIPLDQLHLEEECQYVDLISGKLFDAVYDKTLKGIMLKPYRFMWLKRRAN